MPLILCNIYYIDINGLLIAKWLLLWDHTQENKFILRYLFFSCVEDNFEPWKSWVESCINYRSSVSPKQRKQIICSGVSTLLCQLFHFWTHIWSTAFTSGATSINNNLNLLEEIQGRAAKMIRGARVSLLWGMDERSWLFSLEKKILQRLYNSLTVPRGGCKKVREGL